MTIDEPYTSGVSMPQPTIDEMLALARQLQALTPKCWHNDLVTGDFLPKRDDGIVYACVKCLKKFVVPQSVFADGKPPQRLSIDPFVDKSFGIGATE